MNTASDELRRKIERDIADEAKRSKNDAMWAKLAALTPPEPSAAAAHYPASEFDWYADQGHFDGPEVGEEHSDKDRAFAFSAQGAFFALCKEKTGDSLSDEKLVEMRNANALRLRQSHEIAARMCAAKVLDTRPPAERGSEEFGPFLRPVFNAYRTDSLPMWRYHVHSGHLEVLPNFRRIAFLPYMANALRAPMVAAIEAFLQHEPFARMWTMTSGPRVPLAGIRERAKWLHRKLSDLNAQPFMKEAGVEIVLRATELGSPETDANGNLMGNAGEIERDETGEIYFHVHAHCVVIQRKGFIPPEKWATFIGEVGKFWGHWWKDGSTDEDGKTKSGRIVNPREVCKYVTKPGELLKLSGAELVALYDQLYRLKLIQPMGALADEIREREEKNLRLVTKRTPDGAVYREVENWNRHARRTRTEAHADAAARLARKLAPSGMKVLALCVPGFGPSGVSEPRVVLTGATWSESDARAHPQVAALIRATAHEFWAGVAIRVHTCTSTVLETRDMEFVAKMDPPKVPLSGAELAGLSR